MSQRYVPETWEDAIAYYSDEGWELDVKISIIEHFQKWECPRCGHFHEDEEYCYYIRTREIDKCRKCLRQFSWRHGTIFVDSALPLWKWCVVIWHVVNAEKTNSYEVHRRIGIQQKTAWELIKKIRERLQADEKFHKWVYGEWSWFRVCKESSR